MALLARGGEGQAGCSFLENNGNSINKKNTNNIYFMSDTAGMPFKDVRPSFASLCRHLHN